MGTNQVYELIIEAGCVQVNGVPNTWLYTYTNVYGLHKVLFLVPEGETPQIGDSIIGGALKKQEGYRINNDTTRQQRKLRRDRTWGR